jgi:hypothetical protein
LFAIIFLLISSTQIFSADYPINVSIAVASQNDTQHDCAEQSTISERKSLFSEFALLELPNSDETSSVLRSKATYGKSGLSAKELQFICISDNKSKNSLNSCYSSSVFPLLV